MTYDQALGLAKKLVEQMTPEEMISQLLYNSPAIERLGINEMNWWNEALHGVARAGTATVFPQAIGLAATFDPSLINEIAKVISIEARAKYNQSIKQNDRDIYKGVTFWSPNINIFRDPKWGRGQETYGEDPFLTATMGCEFINGLQGDGEYLRTAACAKHFAVHSGPEATRHGFNALVSKKDLWETYLPAFEWAVKSAGVIGVMGAYNSVNGEPCCASKTLIKDILLNKWGFKGYFVSDCGAIADIYKNHHYTDSDTESAALSLKCGCDLNCGEEYQYLIEAYEEDLITDDDLKNAASHVFAVRYLLGEFEENNPFADIGFDKLDCPAHKSLNIIAARKSLVLLKNENNFLPLSTSVKNIAVVGPNAMSIIALEGNYNGRASEYITVADGIRKVFCNSTVQVAEGSHIWREKQNYWNGFGNLHSTGVAAASSADVTVLCLGLDSMIEGEEGFVSSDYTDKGDKCSLYLPDTQQELARKICDCCDNVIVIVMAGSAIDLGDYVRNKAKAIIHAWYPGAVGGLAIAELIAGAYSPSGRLPLTFYYGNQQLPAFDDYSMQGRTYRFIKEKPLYPFGYGLSYTTFSYGNVAVYENEKDKIHLTVKVTNNGNYAGSEAVQVYAKYTDSRCRTPNFQLCGFNNIQLEPGETAEIGFYIDDYWLKAVNDEGQRIAPDGGITLYVGGHQPDCRSNELYGYECITVKLQ